MGEEVLVEGLFEGKRGVKGWSWEPGRLEGGGGGGGGYSFAKEKGLGITCLLSATRFRVDLVGSNVEENLIVCGRRAENDEIETDVTFSGRSWKVLWWSCR